MTLREWVLENFAGDLEYHPRRGFLYLVIGTGAACAWIFTPYELKFTTMPLVFALGCIPLFGKAIYLFRKSSEGLGLTMQDHVALSESARHKKLPSVPSQAAQVAQDFGMGPLFFWPLLNMGRDLDHAWGNPPRSNVMLTGCCLVGVGWLIRRLTGQTDVPAK